MHLIKQHDTRDCGAACLAMIAYAHGIKISLAQCRELTKTDRMGTNIYGIVDGAKQIGFKADALEGSLDELLAEITTGTIHFPFIAHIVTEESMYHFVVVYAIKSNVIYILDPAKGKRKYSLKHFADCWTGCLVTFERNTTMPAAKDTSQSILKKYWSLLKEHLDKILGILVLSILSAAIGVIGAFVFEVVIDEFINSSNTAPFATFNVIFISILFLYLFQLLLDLVRGKLVIHLSKEVDIRLTLAYFQKVLTLPISSLSIRQTGDYLSRMSDITAIRDAVSNATIIVTFDSIMALGGGVILYYLNDKMFFVTLIMLLLYFVLWCIYRKPIEKTNRNVMEKNAYLQSLFKEDIDGIETIKACDAANQVQEKWITSFYQSVDSIVKNNLFSMSQEILTGTIENICVIIMLWIGFSFVIDETISMGILMTFYALIGYFTNPIKNLIQLQPTIQKALVAADRINDIIELKSETLEQSAPTDSIQSIELKNINFRYGNRNLILKDVSIKAHAGEKVAIIGESGSGKSTLAKILLGFYQPEQGEIFINEQQEHFENLKTMRTTIAYVKQDTFLFSDTIKNNLLLGNSQNISQKDFLRICRLCKVDTFVEQLPQKYDTILEEQGNDLSGGQKQRLAIARALLRNPQILILDEATSHLDSISETVIQNAIKNFNPNMICIVIAHRLNIIQDSNMIYVLNNETIAEQGTHEELLQLNGKYTELWNNQQ